MPIEFFTSLELDLVMARWWGVIDEKDGRANFLKYLGDANYKPGRTELIDLSGIERFDLDFADVRALLRIVNDQVPGSVIHTRSVVWAPNDAGYGVTRMYQQLAEVAGGISVDPHREEIDALKACNLPFTSVADLLAHGNFTTNDPD